MLRWRQTASWGSLRPWPPRKPSFYQFHANLIAANMSAKQFLASTPLSSVLSHGALVTCTTGCRVEAAIKTLDEHSILSLPILAKVQRVRGHFGPCTTPCGRSDAL